EHHHHGADKVASPTPKAGMEGMEHHHHEGMEHEAPAGSPTPGMEGMDHGSMPGMEGMEHGGMDMGLPAPPGAEGLEGTGGLVPPPQAPAGLTLDELERRAQEHNALLKQTAA